MLKEIGVRYQLGLALAITLTGLTYGWSVLWHPSLFVLATGIAFGVIALASYFIETASSPLAEVLMKPVSCLCK